MGFSASSNKVTIETNNRSDAPAVRKYFQQNKPMTLEDAIHDYAEFDGDEMCRPDDPSPREDQDKLPKPTIPTPATTKPINVSIGQAALSIQKLADGVALIAKGLASISESMKLADISEFAPADPEINHDKIKEIDETEGEWRSIKTDIVPFDSINGIGEKLRQSICDCYPTLGELVHNINVGQGFKAIKGISQDKAEQLYEVLISALSEIESSQ